MYLSEEMFNKYKMADKFYFLHLQTDITGNENLEVIGIKKGWK
jgi:hypothetical protein